jgi:hypothetical protein
MFQLEDVGDQPLRWSKDMVDGFLMGGDVGSIGKGPILLERTPVRMDISHSWYVRRVGIVD